MDKSALTMHVRDGRRGHATHEKTEAAAHRRRALLDRARAAVAKAARAKEGRQDAKRKKKRKRKDGEEEKEPFPVLVCYDTKVPHHLEIQTRAGGVSCEEAAPPIEEDLPGTTCRTRSTGGRRAPWACSRPASSASPTGWATSSCAGARAPSGCASCGRATPRAARPTCARRAGWFVGCVRGAASSMGQSSQSDRQI